ncbi:MAG: zinc-binding alcohol dehydrogenase [Myxococcales bacterium]|nr:zinc-binding alcohol dehydrogenase [Myxococcales bacterium]
MEARALWVVGPSQAELRTEQLPDPAEGQVQVRTRFSGVSRGTEALVVRGGVPDDQRSLMRSPHQVGDFPWPVKYGYCSVGRVEAGALPAGTPVFCLHPHQDAYVVHATAAHPLPEGLPEARAVLAANVETALNVAWDLGAGPGDRLTVVGAGVVGALTAWVLGQLPGADVELVDVRSDRQALAEHLGVRFALPDAARADRDGVVEASGSGAGLHTALQLAGFEATIAVASWYGDADVRVPLGGAFHSQRLTLRSTQVGHVAPQRAPRWSTSRRLEAALRLLASAPELDALVDSEGSFDDAPTDLVRVATGQPSVLCHRIRYP